MYSSWSERIETAAALHEALLTKREQLKPEMLAAGPLRAYALLDITRISAPARLASALWPAASRASWINLYDDLPRTDLARSGPHLLEVPNTQMAMTELCSQHMNEESISFLLATCPLSTLDHHLRELREINLPDGGGALFRFQDTHVTSALWPLLDATRTTHILGPAHAWLTLDACGTLHILDQTSIKISTQSGTALSFDRATIAALDEALFPWTVADQIDDIDGSLLNGLRACARHTLVIERIARARALGLTHANDLALYCALSLQLPEGFEKLEPFVSALRQARESALTRFGDVLDTVSPQQWEATDKALKTP